LVRFVDIIIAEGRGDFVSSYQEKLLDGSISTLAKDLMEHLKRCDLCLHQCGVNRFEGKVGFCSATADVEIGMCENCLSIICRPCPTFVELVDGVERMKE